MQNTKLFSIALIALAFTHFGFARHKKNTPVVLPPPTIEQHCPPPHEELAQAQTANTISTAIAPVSLAQPIQCEDLQEGQSRLVQAKDTESPTTVHHMYKLTRTGATDYEVVLNLNFKPANGSNAEMINKEFHEKATRCYQAADRALLGPSGEHLHIRLATPNEEGLLPPVHDINVADGRFRGDSDDYNSSTFDCPTILHESLHLMGLVDEYKETKIGLVLDPKDPSGKSWVSDTKLNAWDCRAIGDNDSIMSGMEKAWSKSFGESRMTFFQVDCTCRSPKCKKAFMHPDPNLRDCPAGGQDSPVALSAETNGSFEPGIKVLGPDHFVITKDMRSFSGASLLKPAHFNSIAHPGCAENLPYYQCAASAYKTSKEHNGEGCPVTPSFCHDGTTNWTKGITTR